MKKKIGIIGCGAVTEQLYLKTLPLFEDIQISYLADKDLKRAEKLALNYKAEATADLTVLRKNSDVIIVCTPPDSHYNLVKDSIESGKLIICEKPFLTEAKKVTELVEISNKANSTLLVPHFRRLFPNVQLAKKLIETSGLGRLTSIQISEGGRFNWGAVSNYFMSNPLGGVTLDTGSHTLDMALFASGLDNKKLEIKSVKVTKDKQEPSHEVDADLIVDIASGPVNININLSRYRILANQIVFSFERGRIIIPAGSANFAKIEGNNHKAMVYADNKIPNNAVAFYEMYNQIFIKQDTDIFNASRFFNQINILESINNG